MEPKRSHLDIFIGVVVVAIAILALVSLVTSANAKTRWPRQYTVNATTVGDSVFTLPANTAVTLMSGRPVPFCLALTATGGYALPNMGSWSALADGAAAKVRLLNLDSTATTADSVYVDSMGSATNIFLFGY